MDITAHATTNADARTPAAETVRVRGEALAGKVKTLLHEGNVRRIIIRNDVGHTVIEIPVTAGVVAAVVAPVLIGVAAIAAMASNWEVEVERAPLRPRTDDGAVPSPVRTSAT